MFHHRAFAVFVLVTLWPNMAWAQAEKVGIVTTLVGNVTARRVILPEPVPLKFKDDVFYEDTITTGAESLARVLLGGKSIVTIRERSVLRITESPGRSFINLESGKIGLAVARDKLGPGESVDIRTPNAVVGVRGTVVVTEVLPGASNIYFLRGSGECSVIDPRTGRRIGAPVIVKPFEAFKVVGSIMRIDPIPPSQVGQITAGLEGKGFQHIEGGNKEQVKKQVTDATAAVVAVLASGAAVATIESDVRAGQDPDRLNVVVPTTGLVVTDVPPPPVIVPPPPPPPSNVPSNIVIDPALAPFLAATAPVPNPVVQIPGGSTVSRIPENAFDVTAAAPVPTTLGRPLLQTTLLSTDSGLQIDGNLLMVGGQLSSTSGLPVLSTDPTPIRTGGDFIQLNSDARVSVDSLLLSDSDGIFKIGGSLLALDAGATVTSSSASPLVGLDHTNVDATGDFVRLDGTMNLSGSFLTSSRGATLKAVGDFVSVGPSAAITLGGPLLEAADSIVAAANVLRITGGTVTTSSTLLSLARSDIVAAENLVRLVNGAQVVAAAGLLSARNTSIETGNRQTNTQSLVAILDGSQVTVTGASPLISLDKSVITTAGNVVTLRRSRSDAASRLTLDGSLFVATNGSQVDTSSLGAAATFGIPPTACCNGFHVTQGAQLIGNGTSDLIRLVGSEFRSGPDAFSGGNFLLVADTFTGAPVTELVKPAAVTIAGRLLSTDGSSVGALFSLLAVFRSTFTSTTPNALIDTLNSSLLFGGKDPTQPGDPTTFGRVLQVIASATPNTPSDPATVGLTGPLALLTGGKLTTTADLVAVFNGGSVSSAAGTALIRAVAAIVTAGSSTPSIFGRALFLTGQGGPGATAFATLNLSGPFWSSLDGTLTMSGGLVGVFEGAKIIAGAGGPFASIEGGTHAIGTLPGSSIFFMQGRSTATTVETIDGIEITRGTDEPITTGRTLLSTSGATITSDAGAVFDTMLFQATAPIFNASLNSNLTFENDAILFSKNVKMTTTAPVVALNASALTSMNGAILNLNASSLLQVFGDLFSLSNGSLLRTLNGPLIRVANGSVLNVTGALAAFLGSGNVINVTNSLCSAGCLTFPGGITVAFSGTPPGNVSIGSNPFRNPSSGSLVKSPNAAVIVIQGNSKVTIAGTP